MTVVTAPLTHGASVALALALGSVAVMWLIALILERRLLRAADMADSFMFGDPLLAVALAAEVHINRGAVSRWPAVVAVTVAWLIFGAYQWRAEVGKHTYTFAQAVSPTKLWHQFGIYPTLGTWLVVSTPGAVTRALHKPVWFLLAALCCAFWIAALRYDQRHPKLGHPPYNWKRLAPAPRPWPQDSLTLAACSRRQRE
jgi:hypothetical protein